MTAAGGPASGADDPGWANRVRGAATDPAVDRGDHRARRRADPRHLRPQPDVRRRLRLPPPGAHHVPPHRRRQGAPAAHQPGRARPRLQPDVRRAGHARAAPPQAARGRRRPVGSHVMSPRWGRTSSPHVAVARGGEGARRPPRRPTARFSPAPATPSTSSRTARPAASPGSRSRPPTGTATPTPSGSPRSAAGATSARSTPPRSPSPDACSSWCASGSPRASSCSATSRSRDAADCASSPAGRRPARAVSSGSTSTTRASIRTTRDVREAARAALEQARHDVGLP